MSRDECAAAPVCGKAAYWWDGEYEGECELPEGHEGDHFDGLSWFNDDGENTSYATSNRTTSAAHTAPPDVFEKMRRVSTRLDEIEEANRGELWTIERLRRVLAVIQDASVTYGIISDGGTSHTPMMVERDAIVEALYGDA